MKERLSLQGVIMAGLIGLGCGLFAIWVATMGYLMLDVVETLYLK